MASRAATGYVAGLDARVRRARATRLNIAVVRYLSALIACAATCAFPAASMATPGASQGAPRPSPIPAADSSPQPSTPASSAPPAAVSGRQARRAEARRFVAIANALPKVRALRAEYPRSFEFLRDLQDGDREVLYYEPRGSLPPKEIGLVLIDGRTGRVLEAWTGFQLEWTMARGYPRAFGKHVNALYIWLPLCALFVLPFVNFRRLFSLLHLDLLVLVSFSASLAFFNHGHIYASVPLAYPPLLYLLARMLVLTRPGSRRRVAASGSEVEQATDASARELRPPDARSGSLHLLVPVPWLALGVVLLICFRVGLNVLDSSLSDVGYAGVLGAQRIVRGEPLYGSYPGHEHSDTYGPVNYEAYVPLEQAFGTRGASAAQAGAILFDLLAITMLFLLGRRVRGPTLGIALAYGWASYPFTLFALENDSNDALVAVLVLAAMLAATYRSNIGRATRGAVAALAGLAKFAPLALAPLLATHGLRELPPGRRPRALVPFLAGFLGAAVLVSVPALSHDSPRTIYDQTIGFQSSRTSPFSVWGLYGGLGGLQLTVQVGAVVLALALAIVPRRPDLIGLASACAAVLVAVQLGVNYWFYTYILWFFPLALVALLGRLRVSEGRKGSTSFAARSGQRQHEPLGQQELVAASADGDAESATSVPRLSSPPAKRT